MKKTVFTLIMAFTASMIWAQQSGGMTVSYRDGSAVKERTFNLESVASYGYSPADQTVFVQPVSGAKFAIPYKNLMNFIYPPVMPGTSNYQVVNVENLQTRVRIVEPKGISPQDVEYFWLANPKDMIINYPPYMSYKGNTYFGYTDSDGEIFLCEALNFPDSARQWKGEFVYGSLGTITEINVQMSGTVRLYTDDTGKKYGTMELTSLEPTGPESGEPPHLQPGVYVETYPHPGETRIDVIDGEKIKITKGYSTDPYSYMYKYEIRENEYAIILTEEGATAEDEMFFRMMNSSKFEIENIYPTTAQRTGITIMTFEKNDNLSTGQELCRYSQGQKVCYEISATKMLVRSDNLDITGIENALQNTVTGNLKKIIDLGLGLFYIEMENTGKEKILELQRQWNAREDVIYVSPVLLNGGNESAFANQVIIMLKSKDDYPVLQKYAEAYNIRDIKRLFEDDVLVSDSQKLIYTLILPHNPEKNAMVTACELHETGLFEFAEPDLIALFPL